MLSYELQLLIGSILQERKEKNKQRNKQTNQKPQQPPSFVWRFKSAPTSHDTSCLAGSGPAVDPLSPRDSTWQSLQPSWPVWGHLPFSCTFSLVWNPAPSFCVFLCNVIHKNHLVPHLIFSLVPFKLSNGIISAENVLNTLDLALTPPLNGVIHSFNEKYFSQTGNWDANISFLALTQYSSGPYKDWKLIISKRCLFWNLQEFSSRFEENIFRSLPKCHLLRNRICTTRIMISEIQRKKKKHPPPHTPQVHMKQASRFIFNWNNQTNFCPFVPNLQ